MPLHPIEAIASKILEFATDPNLNIHIGQQARRSAEQALSIGIHVQKIQDVYEKLLIPC